MSIKGFFNFSDLLDRLLIGMPRFFKNSWGEERGLLWRQLFRDHLHNQYGHSLDLLVAIPLHLTKGYGYCKLAA